MKDEDENKRRFLEIRQKHLQEIGEAYGHLISIYDDNEHSRRKLNSALLKAKYRIGEYSLNALDIMVLNGNDEDDPSDLLAIGLKSDFINYFQSLPPPRFVHATPSPAPIVLSPNQIFDREVEKCKAQIDSLKREDLTLINQSIINRGFVADDASLRSMKELKDDYERATNGIIAKNESRVLLGLGTLVNLLEQKNQSLVTTTSAVFSPAVSLVGKDKVNNNDSVSL
jgi:hypothetical protein